MKSVAGTLDQLVRFLTEERKGENDAIQQILLSNHPVFHRFQGLTDTSYRIFFANEEELSQWLRANQWTKVNDSAYDKGSYREWINRDLSCYIRLTEPIFEKNGNLKIYIEDNWDDSWLELLRFEELDGDELDGEDEASPAAESAHGFGLAVDSRIEYPYQSPT